MVNAARLRDTQKTLASLAECQDGYSSSQECNSDEEIHRDDIDGIFPKDWIFVGVECELPVPGDCVTVRGDTAPVIVVWGEVAGRVPARCGTCWAGLVEGAVDMRDQSGLGRRIGRRTSFWPAVPIRAATSSCPIPGPGWSRMVSADAGLIATALTSYRCG